MITEIQELISTSESSDVAAIYRKVDASTQSSFTRTTDLTPSTSTVSHLLSTTDIGTIDNDNCHQNDDLEDMSCTATPCNDSVFLQSMDFTPDLVADTSSNERSDETNRPSGDRNAFDYLRALSPITIVQESEPDFSNYTNTGSPDYDYLSPSGNEDIILLSSSEEDN